LNGKHFSHEEGMPWCVYRVALGVIVPVILERRPPWVTGKPSGMHRYTQIYVYSYILLGILKFALKKENS
jgi:hypothetical protein